MKVIYQKNTAKDIDLKEETTILSNEHEYWIDIGSEYLVMDLMINKRSSCLYYLIDINSRPFWFPYLLFTISDNSLPSNWFIRVYDKKSKGDIFYLSGFEELCNDEDFHDLLMDRDEVAMRTYFRRKIEQEKFEEEKEYI